MKHKKICIMILTGIYIFFISIFNVKAEILATGLYGNNITNMDNSYTVWSNGCGPLDDNNSIGACPINNVTFWGSNPNNYGRFFITNGGVLSNKTISFVLMKNSGAWPIDLTGVYLTDNNVSYSCEIYNTISSQNGIFYNVICPNLPTLTGNGTSISYGLRSNSDIGAGNTQSFYINMGLSAINGFENGTTTINDIKNTTNNINNSINEDVDNNYKESPNQSEYNNYQEKENNIIDQISDTDTSVINIQNNNNANLFIWDTITRSLQSHAKVMALMISILSIGIIKLILNR